MEAERPVEMVLPPWLIGSEARESLREALGRARWMLITYWALMLSGYLVLAMVAMLYWHGGADSLMMLGTLSLVSLVGSVLGNLVGLLRVKAWIIHVMMVGTIVVSCLLSPVLGVSVIWLITFLWSVGGGYHALQRKFSLWALWIPMICWVAAILTMVERHGMHRWESGAKHTIWNPVGLGLLFVMIVLFFLFLSGQEHFHLRVWQAGGNMGSAVLTKHRAKDSVRLTGRGVLAIVVLGLVVSGAVALVSPYLFRTRAEQGRRRNDSEQQQETPREERRPDFDGDGLRESLKRAARRMQEQAKDVFPFVPLFFFNRPLRRAWLLWRLRRRKGAPPSERAAGLWRYVTIALGDAKVSPKPGESLEEVAIRINTARDLAGVMKAEGLAESAEVYGRLRYGLGIPEGALDRLQVEAERAFVSVRAPMTRWERVKSWWRKIE